MKRRRHDKGNNQVRPPNFALVRQKMVTEQLIERGIRDEAVLEAMQLVPRERFVLPVFRGIAYDDSPLPIQYGQTISQPFILAYMLSALKLTATDRVLEIGTGSGYSAAVLSKIALKVFSVERHEGLVKIARRRLAELGCTNVELRHGDGTLGWPEKAPFDAIVVAAGGPQIPQALLDQLAVQGKLIIPVGQQSNGQILIRCHRRDTTTVTRENLTRVRFVPLIGAGSWQDEPCHYEELGHTADIGVRVRGRTPSVLFSCAALAMFAIMGATTLDEDEAEVREITIDSEDSNSLLVDWLNELLYEHEISGKTFTHCQITAWTPTRLEAQIHGHRLLTPPIRHIKAVTYHQLKLVEMDGYWLAEIYFDV